MTLVDWLLILAMILFARGTGPRGPRGDQGATGAPGPMSVYPQPQGAPCASS